MNVAEALALVAETEFSPFDESDFDAFSGVESQNPLIGFNGVWIIIIDGDTVEISGVNFETHRFRLKGC